MLKLVAFWLAILIGPAAALADAREDCDKKSDEVAIKGCTELIRRNPRNAVAYYNRGIEYNAKGERDRAIADYSKAIEINPKYVAAYTNRGAIYNERGEATGDLADQDRAIADYTKAIEINPKYEQAYYNRGNA